MRADLIVLGDNFKSGELDLINGVENVRIWTKRGNFVKIKWHFVNKIWKCSQKNEQSWE